MNEPKPSKFFNPELIEAMRVSNLFNNHADEYEAINRTQNPITFFEVVVNFEDLAIKKAELNIVRRLINLRDVYLIADRLFFGINGSNNSYIGDPNKVAVEIERYAIANNLISIKGFRVVECDWIGGLLELFARSPISKNMQSLASQDRNTCGHEWTFDELLARVAVGENQESQRISKIAQDALTQSPPPIIIIKNEAEIEQLRIQYQPKEKL
jgi:hypothetical protein